MDSPVVIGLDAKLDDHWAVSWWQSLLLNGTGYNRQRAGRAATAAATGSVTIGPVWTATGSTTLRYTMNVGCPLTVLRASTYNLRWVQLSVERGRVSGHRRRSAAGRGRPHGVPYSLGVMDSTRQSETLVTAKGTSFGTATPIPVPTSPSPTARASSR